MKDCGKHAGGQTARARYEWVYAVKDGGMTVPLCEVCDSRFRVALTQDFDGEYAVPVEVRRLPPADR